jgi:histidine ammonia-lyase
LSVRQTDRALGLLEDLLAIEVLLARDMLGVADATRTLGTGTTALLRTVHRALTDAEPTPGAAHAALRAHFPAV